MREVQLDTVKSRCACAASRIAEQTGQMDRQIADVIEVCVSNELTCAELECVELSLVQYPGCFFRSQREQPLTDIAICCGSIAKCRTMLRCDGEKLRKITRGHRPSSDRQKVDQLDEQPRLSVACFANDPDEIAKPGQKTLVTGTEQGAAGHVPDSSSLNNNGAGTPAREALIPFEHFGSDEAVLAGAPRHHGGDPRALGQLQRPNPHARKKTRRRSFPGRWPIAAVGRMFDALGGPPHRVPQAPGNSAVASISTFA